MFFLMEFLFPLLGFLIILGLLFVFVGGPILGLIGYWRGLSLRRRIAALEAEVASLRAGTLTTDPTDLLPRLEPEPRPEPSRPEAVAAESVPPEKRETPSRLEGLLGGHVLGWAAVVLLLLAAGYFLQYAFQNGLIGPFGQVSLGILGGAGLCVLGYLSHRRGRWLFAQMLSAAGVAILYLSTFASFGYYELLPMSRAGPYLVAVVVLTAGLAVTYPAFGIAILALVGGLTAPTLLHSERDPYLAFFLYLALLDAATLSMAVLRGWRLLAPLALIGVQSLFWGWAFGHYHPEKLTAVLIFQGVVYLLHTAHDVLLPVLRKQFAHPLQLLDLILNATALAVAGTAFLRDDLGPWLPHLAVGAAILYALQSRVVQLREPIDAWLQLTLVAVGFSFLAVAFALRLDAPWAAVAWAVQGLGLWWYGLRVRSQSMRWLAAVLLFLAVFSVLANRNEPAFAVWRGGPIDFFLPLINQYAFPGVLVTACLLAAAYATRVMMPPRTSGPRGVWLTVVLVGLVLGLHVLTADVTRFVHMLESRNGWSRYDSFSLVGMSRTITWGLYAGLVLAVGFWRDSRTLRGAALGLFGLALLKALFVDSASLVGFSRVVAFFVLAVVMGLGAWTYQRLEHAHRSSSPEVRS